MISGKNITDLTRSCDVLIGSKKLNRRNSNKDYLDHGGDRENKEGSSKYVVAYTQRK